MSDSGQFCPNCGDPIEVDPAERAARPELESRDRRKVNALCDTCYFDRFDLVDAPDQLDVQVCARCGAVKEGNRWVDVGARDYTDVAIEQIADALAVHVDATQVTWEVDPEQVDATTVRMHCAFSGVVRGTPISTEVIVPVRIARGTCQRCGRIAGDYYAGTIQLRAADRTPTDQERTRAKAIAEEVVADMTATGDREAFVTEITEVDEGLNIKVSTTKIGEKVARRLTEEFGGSFSTSETLVTQDEDGQDVYRVTYAVRLPPYTPGEVIDPDDGDGPVLVRSVQGNLKGRRLTTGGAYEAAFEDGDAPDARRLGWAADAEETTLVAVEDEHAIQVLDPETYQPKTIPRPADFEADDETVRVFKSRAGLHVLPEA
ncbi:MAG: 60S ribosomal export protein NMD3 [Halobacteriales archaeon]